METKTEQEMQVLPAAQPAHQVAAPAQPMTAMDMVATMVNRGASIEELQKMMDFADRIEQREGQKAYIGAMSIFKRNAPTIEKGRTATVKSDKGNFTYKYANLADVCAAVVEGLAAVGISHKWSTEQGSGSVKVTCTLTHERGYSESTSLAAGMDKSGTKNDLQALGSTISYLERYTLLAATGLAVDDEQDDDGAGVTQGDRAELRQAASDMRKNTKKQPEGPSAELVERAQKAADGGLESFDVFWKGITGAERGLLRGHVQDFERRVKAFGQQGQ